jgi:hypothetical protein
VGHWPRSSGPPKQLERDYEVSLNELALRRLETLTGRTAIQLRTALTNLNRIAATPDDTPMIWLYRNPNLHNHCDRCVARIPGNPKIRVHRLLFPRLCRRHDRWLDPTQRESRLGVLPQLAG